MTFWKTSALVACASMLAVGACAKKAEATAPSEKAASGAASAPVDFAQVAADAVDSSSRPEEDRADDTRRKARTALTFFQIAPGETVFEMEAGGGYYTELLSHAVGPAGHVVMQNPEEFLKYVDKKIEARLAGDRLPNVTQSISAFDKLDAADASVDLVTWVQGPHDIWVENKDGAIFADPDRSFAEIYRILKPGGTFVVIDHAAQKDAPSSTGNTLHRIDPAIVTNLADKAGFALDTENLFLANPDDDLMKSVFDESIRGHTSQFAVRFKKPSAE